MVALILLSSVVVRWPDAGRIAYRGVGPNVWKEAMALERDSLRLCHGISFSRHDPAPVLRLRKGTEWINEPLELGRTMALEVGVQRWCLGHVLMDSDGTRRHNVCTHSRVIASGTQCATCRRLDQTKFMHHFHKTGQAPEGLRRYLEQPHLLYIASFADGTTKVGTASEQSKWSRLATQGAVIARYVAHAPDGAAVRVLEDLVTEQCGIRQQVRQKAKIRGLESWDHNLASLEELNRAAARAVHRMLESQRGLDRYGITLLDELWRQPTYARQVVNAWDARSIHRKDPAIPGGEGISLRIHGVLGQTLMIDTGEHTELVLLDLAELKTRALVLRQAHFVDHGGQASLF